MSYHMTRTIRMSFDEAVSRVTDELKREGFGVLTEIDVQATLKKKIDVDFRRYVILGACNPKLAHQVLDAEDKLGVLLPCNVVVQERADGTGIDVSAMNPAAAMAMVDDGDVRVVAEEVRAKLARVVAAL
jgi:uncharacterized protein (DUF302 family)